MERRSVFLPLLVVLLTSCAERGFHEPLASIQDVPATTTYSPPEPTSRKVGAHKVIEGLSQVSDLKLNIDGPTAQSSLKGTVSIQPTGESSLNIPFEVSGGINSEDYMAYMSATNQAQLDAMNMKVGAKLTCLDTACTESFIDIYINYKGYIYHHQVEAKGNDIPEVTAQDKKAATPAQDSSQETPKVKNPQPTTPKTTPAPKMTPVPKTTPGPKATPTPKAPLGEVMGEDDDGSRFEHEIDDDSEAGAYVGEPQKDLEVLFPDTTMPAPVKEEPKTPKSAEPKNTEPKKDSTKAPTPPTPKEKEPSGVKGALKRLGQAVTALGKNNFVRGHLENAANILAYQQSNPNAGFQILYPKREAYYGTDDMLAVLAYMGNFNNQRINGYVSNIGDISRKNGGKLGSHSSHQMGLDADISYYFDAKEKQKGLADAVASAKPVRSFMAEEQWEMFKVLVGQGNVDRIFIHPALKKEICEVATRKGDFKPGVQEGVSFEALRVLRSEVHHDDHFHLRLKCSTAQPRCRQMAPPARTAGC